VQLYTFWCGYYVIDNSFAEKDFFYVIIFFLVNFAGSETSMLELGKYLKMVGSGSNKASPNSLGLVHRRT
jgi:hypothetical protein